VISEFIGVGDLASDSLKSAGLLRGLRHEQKDSEEGDGGSCFKEKPRLHAKYELVRGKQAVTEFAPFDGVECGAAFGGFNERLDVTEEG